MGIKEIVIFLMICCKSQVAVSLVEEADKVIAIVNDEPILLSDLNRAMWIREHEISKAEGTKENILNFLIEEKLIKQYAKEKGVIATRSDIENELALIKKQFKNDMQFEHALSKEGYTLETFKEKLESHIIYSKFIRQEILMKINVSDKEIEDYYNSHKKEFEESGAVHLIRIITKNKKKINSAFAELSEKGKNFIEVAKKYNKDKNPDIGFIKLSELNENIFNVIKDLKIDEFSQVVNIEGDFMIFKVEEKAPAKQLILSDSFETGGAGEKIEVRNFIRRKLFLEKQKEKYEILINEIKTKSIIEIKP